MEYKNKIDDLISYVREIAKSSDCVIGYSEILNKSSMIAVFDNPGFWTREYANPFYFGSMTRMLLFKIENNKFVIKGACQLDPSKYRTDFKYVTAKKKALLKFVKERESKEKK